MPHLFVNHTNNSFNLYCNRNLFRVDNLGYDIPEKMSFNLYCNRNLFRAAYNLLIDFALNVSIFIVIEIYSELHTQILLAVCFCFNLYCNRNLFRVFGAFIIPPDINVSIFIVIEIYSEFLFAPLPQQCFLGFNLYCNRNLFRDSSPVILSNTLWFQSLL